MPWFYIQKTGDVIDPTGVVIDSSSYSGFGNGLNNPALQSEPNRGPIPCGSYRIGPPHEPMDHLGPIAMPLMPEVTNRMFGRFGFFWHGDNYHMNHTGSNGCIVSPKVTRNRVASSSDKELIVFDTWDSWKEANSDLINHPSQPTTDLSKITPN